jgi:very-short-patch-repair endonuclease
MDEMHPMVVQFIENFEQEAHMKGNYRSSVGKAERIFLQDVWGPLMDFNFQGLHAEYPFKDYKNGNRFADFVYTKGGIRLVIEVDGFSTHARDISPGDFDDHLSRQNDLLISGWKILRFSANQVERKSIICQRQISQTIGTWWTQVYGSFSPEEGQVWTLRRRQIIQLAQRQDGLIKTSDLAREFKITNRTASNWLQKFTEEGLLTAVSPRIRITAYKLKGY